MIKTPKSLRLQIGIFGRCNVGKSSFLNIVSGQKSAITSEVPGTTTDIVEKPMELLPIGPVVFLDTAGIDDKSHKLGELRLEKTKSIFIRSDIILLLVEPGIWSEYEDNILEIAKKNNIFIIIVVNKVDQNYPEDEFIDLVKSKNENFFLCSSVNFDKRDDLINELKKFLLKGCPDEYIKPPALIGDLLPSAGTAILIVPIDVEAPKGRIILPQVQTIRDLLDNDSCAIIVKEREYAHVINNLKNPPDIVVCDSQVVLKMIADTPKNIKCTTFSILFARLKGDLKAYVKGIKSIENLKNKDKILILESCTHHALEDDIGRVKIPRWIKQYTGVNFTFDIYSGRDFPDNIKDYKLIIQCGSCMLTRRETLWRIKKAESLNVPITNYGICISYVQGVLEKVIEPFGLFF